MGLKENIERIEAELSEMKKQLKEEEKIDVSKFIERNWNTLTIKWKEKDLVSFWNWNITFWKKINNNNLIKKIEKVTTTLTTIDELKIWDVFIRKIDIKYMTSSDFKVILWNNSDIRIFNISYIVDNWCDYISWDSIFKDDIEVYKINRF